ncbi:MULTISPECIES: alpha/beta fold hydrolase [Comamonas]|uniref:alpha/beta fold hydrolase n=1 Tax=Comamonas TaxID=283 RepID=UPI00050E67D0|nr:MULTISPECIES: alpha/beta hydrolase [Comamonas]KGG87502.1 alpha/beta hydrolase [Comamonas thiooxydans]KGG92478.1 alpha/beta hydrolase [Comamonas thiooxydans]KGG98763.1 alpha/beta hydrolase [Comamonas thiooxydans]KGH04432.1 alpha/beta hydrolase [Comamonas thiooxydans]KGH12835.1 alpha/beta hydrolase [Comamonas thiooxydans]
MSKPCIVFLPGLLCDEVVWQEQRKALSFADSISPSYGHAASIEEMARLVLSEVGAERFSLAGHSMGGRVALEIARMAPQRVERLALLDTGMEPIAAGEAGASERAKRKALLDKALENGMREMGAQWARGMVHTGRLDTPLFEEVLDMVARFTPSIFAAQIDALLGRPDATAVLQALNCPTLLVCGRQDLWSPLSRHERMQQLCPGAELVVIEDSGHMSTMEQPEQVSKALADWMLR